MSKGFLKLLCLAVILWNGAFLFGQVATNSENAPFTYEHYNQIDYGPLKIRTVRGVVRDERGVLDSGAQLGIFTEENHRLVARTSVYADGTFLFPNIAPGRYRLVVKFDGFCPANVPLLVVSSGRIDRIVDVHMKPRGIDTCSFGDLVRPSHAMTGSN